MNKILRYSFMALMAMMFGNVMAQNVIFDFSLETSEGSKESVWGLPASSKNKTVDEKEFTYDGYTIKVAGSEGQGYYWHDKDKYLLLGKTGAYIILPAFDFDVEAIKVYGRTGASGKVTHNIFVGEDPVSTEATGATTTTIFNIAEDKQAAGTIYKFKVTNNNNDQIVKIEICKKGSGTKKAAGLSWGKASTTVTLGGDYTNIPTLQNSNNLSVKCNSSKEEVCTVTDAGVITVVGEGKTTITAAFDGDDEYEAQSVSIEITVNPAIDPDAKGQKNNPYLLTDEDFFTLVMGLKPEDVSSTASSNPKSEKLYVKGYIVNIDEVTDENLQQYGNMTFKIAAVKGDYDADMKLKVYRCNFLENKKFTSADQIKLDDDVIVYGQIQWYGGSPQVISGCNIYSLNGNTSSVNAIKANAQFSGKMYNVAGQVVNKGYKGLVIQDGRKFVNK